MTPIKDAANDVHVALMIHLKLLDLAKAGNKELDPIKYTSSVNPPSQWGDDPKVIAPAHPRPQHMRAYNLWHHQHTPLDKMCDILKTGGRVEPLKESTVMCVVSWLRCVRC
jgi:hypothetical protein